MRNISPFLSDHALKILLLTYYILCADIILNIILTVLTIVFGAQVELSIWQDDFFYMATDFLLMLAIFYFGYHGSKHTNIFELKISLIISSFSVINLVYRNILCLTSFLNCQDETIYQTILQSLILSIAIICLIFVYVCFPYVYKNMQDDLTLKTGRLPADYERKIFEKHIMFVSSLKANWFMMTIISTCIFVFMLSGKNKGAWIYTTISIYVAVCIYYIIIQARGKKSIWSGQKNLMIEYLARTCIITAIQIVYWLCLDLKYNSLNCSKGWTFCVYITPYCETLFIIVEFLNIVIIAISIYTGISSIRGHDLIENLAKRDLSESNISELLASKIDDFKNSFKNQQSIDNFIKQTSHIILIQYNFIYFQQWIKSLKLSLKQTIIPYLLSGLFLNSLQYTFSFKLFNFIFYFSIYAVVSKRSSGLFSFSSVLQKNICAEYTEIL